MNDCNVSEENLLTLAFLLGLTALTGLSVSTASLLEQSTFEVSDEEILEAVSR